MLKRREMRGVDSRLLLVLEMMMDGRDKFGHGLLMWTRHASSVSKMVGVHATVNCLGGWLIDLHSKL
jgi:hypothetical protein